MTLSHFRSLLLSLFLVSLQLCASGCFGGSRQAPRERVDARPEPLIGPAPSVPPPTAGQDTAQTKPRSPSAIDEDFSFAQGFDDPTGRSALAPPPELASVVAATRPSAATAPAPMPTLTPAPISSEGLEPVVLPSTSIFNSPRPEPAQRPAVRRPVAEAVEAVEAPEAISSHGARRTVHTVAPGETLSAIARLYGLSWTDVLRANPALSDPDQIRVDDRLVIPVTR